MPRRIVIAGAIWAATVISVPDEKAWEALRSEVGSADVIVDAIFGTGFRGVASGAVGQAIADINQMSRDATAARPALILAVDTPSGLPSDGGAAEGPVLTGASYGDVYGAEGGAVGVAGL